MYDFKTVKLVFTPNNFKCAINNKKNILFDPVLWKPAHYGTALNYAILYYLKKQIVQLPMAQKRGRKSVAMHNFSTAHLSVSCINDAMKTHIGLRQHIL
jgi:hypothetical protein